MPLPGRRRREGSLVMSVRFVERRAQVISSVYTYFGMRQPFVSYCLILFT